MLEENRFSQPLEWQDYGETAASVPFVHAPSQSYAIPLTQLEAQPAQQLATRTEIDQLLATYRLGKIQKEYKNVVSATISAGIPALILGVLCFLPLILSWFTQVVYLRGLRLLFILGFGFLGYGINRITVGINNIGSNMLYQNPRCYLCSHGVLYIRGKQVQAIRWDNIKAVQKVFDAGISDIPQQYILYPLSSEEPLVLDRLFDGFRIVGKQIEHEVTQRFLPKHSAAFKSSQTLNFGTINVTSQGLTLEETQESLAWEKLGGMYEYRGYLIIKERGNASTWKSIEISTILNLCILLPLIRQIKIDYDMRENELRAWSYQPPVNAGSQHSEWGEYESS